MNYNIEQVDIFLLMQKWRDVRMRVELQNGSGQTIRSFESDTASGSLSVDTASDIRRTCSISLVLDKSVMESDLLSAASLTKQILISYGIYHQAISDYRWYPLGVLVFNDIEGSISASEGKLTLSLLDKMALTTQERASQMGADETVVEVNANIRSAMISTLMTFTTIRDYVVCDFPYQQDTVPYDLTFPCGSLPHDVIAQLRDLYPGYQTYFDVYGTFECQRYPTAIDDPVVLRKEIMDQLLLADQTATLKRPIGAIRNVTEIWGKSIETDRYATSCAQNDGVYTLTVSENTTAYVEGGLYGFLADADSVEGQKIKVDSLEEIPIVIRTVSASGSVVDTPLATGVIKAGYPYAVKYTAGIFEFWGELEVHAIVKEVSKEPTDAERERDMLENDCRAIGYVVNPESPYAVEKIGEIRKVLSGGEFDNIYTSQLALERASYENWKTTRMQDSATISTVLIPFLDVNQKIEYTDPITGEAHQWLVSRINMNFDTASMTIDLTRFYPYYPWL